MEVDRHMVQGSEFMHKTAKQFPHEIVYIENSSMLAM